MVPVLVNVTNGLALNDLGTTLMTRLGGIGKYQ